MQLEGIHLVIIIIITSRYRPCGKVGSADRRKFGRLRVGLEVK